MFRTERQLRWSAEPWRRHCCYGLSCERAFVHRLMRLVMWTLPKAHTVPCEPSSDDTAGQNVDAASKLLYAVNSSGRSKPDSSMSPRSKYVLGAANTLPTSSHKSPEMGPKHLVAGSGDVGVTVLKPKYSKGGSDSDRVRSGVRVRGTQVRAIARGRSGLLSVHLPLYSCLL